MLRRLAALSALALLIASLSAVSPAVEVRVHHTVRIAGQALLLSSEFEVQPKIAQPGGGVQELEVRWPKGFSWIALVVCVALGIASTLYLRRRAVRHAVHDMEQAVAAERAQREPSTGR